VDRIPAVACVGPDAVQPVPLPAGFVAVGFGGVAGSLARAGVARGWPHQPGDWPWSTLAVNLVGAALIAVLLVVLAERWPRSRYPRLVLGTGVLGGFTTFSAFALDTVLLADEGRLVLAGGYLATTVIGCLAACAGAAWLTRAAMGWRRPGAPRRRHPR
jgi:CrcB protein